MEYKNDAHDACKDAGVKSGAKRRGRVGEDTVYGKMEHFSHVEFRHARMPCGGFKFDAGGFKSEAAYDAANEAAVFTETEEDVQRFPVHEAEIGTSGKDGGSGKSVDDGVVARRSDFLYGPRVFGGSAHGLDDVVSFFPFSDKCGDKSGGVLHIAVHGDDGIAAGKIHAAGDGDLVAKVPREGKCPYMGIFFRKAADEFIGIVVRAVVYINQFIVYAGVFHDTGDGVMEKGDIVFFVVNRGDDRNHRGSPLNIIQMVLL